MKYGNRSFWKKFISSPFSIVALIVLAYILTRATFNLHGKVQQGEERLTQAQAELDKLESRQHEVSRKVAALSTDEGIEAEIRTRFHAVREGESVAVIVDDVATPGTLAVAASLDASTATSQATTSVGWWGVLMRVLGF